VYSYKASCRRSSVTIFAATISIFAGITPILADIELQSDNDGDKKAFTAMVDACAGKSQAFKDLVKGKQVPGLKGPQDGIDQDKTHHINIQLVRTGDFIDNAESRGGGGKITVNLANLERLPNPDLTADGKLKTPAGTDWGMTQCELMAHFLKEADVMAKDPGKPKSPKGNPHDRGRDAQNDVRKGFKQFEENPCRSAILPTEEVPGKTFTYIDASGKTQTIKPGNQIIINYGGDHMQVLWFDDQHRLQMAFFQGGMQIPREKLTFPGDTPDGKRNSGYVYAPSSQNGGALAVNADCTDPEVDRTPTPPPAPAGQCPSGGGLAGAINGVACQIQHS